MTRAGRPAREALFAAAAVVVTVLAALVARAGAPGGYPVPVPSVTTVSPIASPRPSGEPAPLPALRVVGLGDSVMAGTNCNCQAIPARLAQKLAVRDGRVVRATNLGVAGYTTQDVLDQLTEDPDARRAVSEADVVILIIGANDLNDALAAWKAADCDRTCYQPRVDAMGTRLAAILRLTRTLRAGRPTTVLVDNYWNVFTDGDVARADGGEQQIDWSAEVTSAANAAIADAARDSGDSVIDLLHPFKHGGDDDPTPLLADDGDHPNKAGVEAIVDANLAGIPAGH